MHVNLAECVRSGSAAVAIHSRKGCILLGLVSMQYLDMQVATAAEHGTGDACRGGLGTIDQG